jgi:ATP-dependent DNA ligase
MQNALNKKAKLLYVVFDVLFVGDIRQRPLLERKELLKALLPRDPLLRYSHRVAQFGNATRSVILPASTSCRSRSSFSNSCA